MWRRTTQHHTTGTSQGLAADLETATRRNVNLTTELATLALQQGAAENAAQQVQEQKQLYQDRAREWQTIIDKTVVESELTKAHVR